MGKEKSTPCQFNLKNMDCEVLDWYRQLANEKNRSLNQQILYVLRRYKQVYGREIHIDNFPFND